MPTDAKSFTFAAAEMPRFGPGCAACGTDGPVRAVPFEKGRRDGILESLGVEVVFWLLAGLTWWVSPWCFAAAAAVVGAIFFRRWRAEPPRAGLEVPLCTRCEERGRVARRDDRRLIATCALYVLALVAVVTWTKPSERFVPYAIAGAFVTAAAVVAQSVRAARRPHPIEVKPGAFGFEIVFADAAAARRFAQAREERGSDDAETRIERS